MQEGQDSNTSSSGKNIEVYMRKTALPEGMKKNKEFRTSIGSGKMKGN